MKVRSGTSEMRTWQIPVLRRVSNVFVSRMKGICWKVLSPVVNLDSGIQVVMQGRSDWDVFAEIFVNREYDTAILEALSASPADSPIWILDLGANVGYFSLR